jgi:hypothetical protein
LRQLLRNIGMFACATNGHPCPESPIHRSETPLAAQIKNLCSNIGTISVIRGSPISKASVAARAALDPFVPISG